MRILICDDKPSQFNRTKSEIESRGEVHGLAGEELKDALTLLFASVSEVLNGNEPPGTQQLATKFDGYDVAIVDNNLTGLELEGARLTAETIIGYLRAFTDVPYIVSLNKNLHVDFDLRYLFGDYQSLADLALNTKHLSSARLWDLGAPDGFAPWYWPRFLDAVDRRRQQIDFLKKNYDRSVWDALGFPTEAEEYLSLRAMSPLSSGDRNIQEAGFGVFFRSSRALPPAEIVKLEQLGSNGSAVARQARFRISAYEVDRWLRRDVLGTQDTLIDLPHLVAQMPFLVGERVRELNSWNAVLAEKEPPFGLDDALFQNCLEPARFEYDMWLPAPCFWWPSLKADERLAECFFAADGDWPDAVFCEDISRFVVVGDGRETRSPREFEVELEGSWGRRHISHVEDVHYSPRSRILSPVT